MGNFFKFHRTKSFNGSYVGYIKLFLQDMGFVLKYINYAFSLALLNVYDEKSYMF